MSTQQNIPAASTSTGSSYGGVKAWLYNNYVHDENAAATTNDDPLPLLSRAQFDRIHLAPMIAGFTLASAPLHLKEPSLTSESEAQASAVLPPQSTVDESPDENSGSEGSLQHAQSKSSSVDNSMFDPEMRYTHARGLSFCSAYEEACLENARLEGYNADVEDNDLIDSDEEEGSLVPDVFPADSTTETSWSDSDSDSDSEDEESRFVESKVDSFTLYYQEETAIFEKCNARLLAAKSNGKTLPSKTMAKKIESGPHIRAWTKKMDYTHARERQIAWTCAAWAFWRADESKGCYAVLKGKLRMLQDRQTEAREALVKDIELWRACDAAGEVL